MKIYTKAKVVTDGVFQRRETGCLWHCRPICSISLKSRLVMRIWNVFAETILQKIVGFEWRRAQQKMGSASGLCKFN